MEKQNPTVHPLEDRPEGTEDESHGLQLWNICETPTWTKVESKDHCVEEDLKRDIQRQEFKERVKSQAYMEYAFTRVRLEQLSLLGERGPQICTQTAEVVDAYYQKPQDSQRQRKQVSTFPFCHWAGHFWTGQQWLPLLPPIHAADGTR